jgi:hypothetical protein
MAAWLTVLKYLGLALAAGSSIWGTVNELTVTVDGRKKLTRAGRVSIALTILGLVISVTSEDIQRRIVAAQAAAEAQRTNDIVMGGQPLTGLTLSWTFGGLDKDLLDVLKKGDAEANKYLYHAQGNRDAQQNGALYRVDQLYPFLLALSRKLVNETSIEPAKDTDAAPPKSKANQKERIKATQEQPTTPEQDPSVLMLLPLDDDQNAVLSFGFLAKLPTEAQGKEKTPPPSKIPPSIENTDYSYFGNTSLSNWPRLDQKADAVTIAWHLDPTTFASSISKQNQAIGPTAKLPEVLHIALIFDIDTLPFTNGNLAAPEDQTFWFASAPGRGEIDPGPAPITLKNGFTSVIRLTPNSSALVAFNYDLHAIYETQFIDSYGENTRDARCVVLEYTVRK